jgi:hypothetical protein
MHIILVSAVYASFRFSSTKDENGNNILSFTSKNAALNLLIPLLPDINVLTSFNITEDVSSGVFDIVASQVGTDIQQPRHSKRIPMGMNYLIW